jgi:cytochrome c1
VLYVLHLTVVGGHTRRVDETGHPMMALDDMLDNVEAAGPMLASAAASTSTSPTNAATADAQRLSIEVLRFKHVLAHRTTHSRFMIAATLTTPHNTTQPCTTVHYTPYFFPPFPAPRPFGAKI